MSVAGYSRLFFTGAIIAAVVLLVTALALYLRVGQAVNGWLVVFGGPAVLLVILTGVTAYNKYRERVAVEQIRDYLLRRFG